MITKQGWVFIAERYNFQIIFGKATAEIKNPYETIETNGFNFFENKEQLKTAVNQFCYEINTKNLLEARLEMRIAQSQKEVDSFSEGNLAIIYDMSLWRDGKIWLLDKRLFGPTIAGRPSEFNGVACRLGYNNFKTFKELGTIYRRDTAKYAAKEAHRQGDNAAVTITKFILEKLN